MQLNNAFDVSAPPERAWAFLLDPERVIPCMPGAELVRVIPGEDGAPDVWEAAAKIKVGPVQLRFKGTVSFQERDDQAHRVVLKAKGRETRGKGVFSATITSKLTATDSGTHIEVETELNISGKMKTFARGMIKDLAGHHTQAFADAMQRHLLAEAEAVAQPEPAPEPEAAEPASPPEATSPSEPVPAPEPAPPPPPPPPEESPAINGLSLVFWALRRAFIRFLKRRLGIAEDEPFFAGLWRVLSEWWTRLIS